MVIILITLISLELHDIKQCALVLHEFSFVFLHWDLAVFTQCSDREWQSTWI